MIFFSSRVLGHGRKGGVWVFFFLFFFFFPALVEWRGGCWFYGMMMTLYGLFWTRWTDVGEWVFLIGLVFLVVVPAMSGLKPWWMSVLALLIHSSVRLFSPLQESSDRGIQECYFAVGFDVFFSFFFFWSFSILGFCFVFCSLFSFLTPTVGKYDFRVIASFVSEKVKHVC